MNFFTFFGTRILPECKIFRYLTGSPLVDVHYSDSNHTELLTLPEAASRLRVNRRTLERLIAAKDFPAPLKIGSRSLVPIADLNSYLAQLLQRRDRRLTP